MPCCFHFVEDVLDLAVGTDHKGHARDSFEYSSIHAFVFDHAEGVTNLLVRVSEQRILKVVLVAELLLLFGRIG